jgi:fibronectin type 3 domain-containing protein
MLKTQIFLLFAIIFSGWFSTMNAQAIESELEAVVNEDEVYLYQMRNLRVDFGYNVYRLDPGADDFIKLNDEPVRGILYPDQLRSALGNNYRRVQQLLETEDENEIYFELRGNSPTARLYTLIFPELAQAVNRLYIDRTAPVGEEVTYRIEVVNQRDQPTGDVIEHTVVLQETEIAVPEITEITNRGNNVTVSWNYPRGGDRDYVIQFELLIVEDEEEGRFRRVHRDLLIRDQSRTSYSYTFQVDDLNELLNFNIVAVDVAGRRSVMSEAAPHLVAENIPPARISNVRTARVDDSIQIQWPMSTELDVAGYHLYRSMRADEGFERINPELIPFTDPIFMDDSIEPGNQYFYRVTAVDENGNESEKSVVVNRQVADFRPPPSPQNLSAEYTHDEGRIDLNWESEPLPGDFRTFILLRREYTEQNPNRSWARVNRENIRESSFTDFGTGGSGFIEGLTFQYGVVAVDTTSNVSDTSFVFVQIPNLTPPEPPRSVTAQSRNGVRVNISWDASISTDVTAYHLYKRTEGGEYSLLSEMHRRDRLYRDEEIEIGREYMYAVAAVDSSGNISDRMEASPVFVRSSAPPRRVRNVRAVALDEGVQVRWEPVVSDALEGYRLYVSDRSTGSFVLLTEEIYTDTAWNGSLPDGHNWVRVTAVDQSGNESRPSDPVRLIIP